MANYFSARIPEEYLNQVIDLALNLNVPPERIISSEGGCSLNSIGIYIKFDDSISLDQFSKKLEEFCSILEKW